MPDRKATLRRESILDDRARLEDFANEFLVACARCGQCARVIPLGGAGDGRALFASRRLVCPSCGDSHDKSVQGVRFPRGSDWYFGRPLWLRVTCAGGELWAFNARHLAWLERYVRATLREQRRDPGLGWSNGSAANRLPKWVKSAKNREDILRGIEKLKRKLSPQ